MPARKTGDGYAKDATALQRTIRALSEDSGSDPEFRERNIKRLQEVVADFNDHTAKRMRERPAAPAPEAASTPARKRNGPKSAEA
jgi:hypothetical protein